MEIKEEFIFWKLAFHFITEEGYGIIRLFEEQTEIWLEKFEDKKSPVIRILLHNLDWSNSMQRDIEFAAVNGERVRRQIGRGELQVLNIYVSQYPPVDEYEYRLETPFIHPEGNKTSVSTVIFAKDEYEKGFLRITNMFHHDMSFSIDGEYSPEFVEELKKSTLEQSLKKEKAEKAVFLNGKPFFTYVLLAIQILVFLWLELHGGSTSTATLIKYGAKVNPLILDGEWWRFVTPIFLHSGFLHCLMNSLALYYLGADIERMYGNTRFLFIYFFAGIIGSIASFIFSTSYSVGASGAIFGCFGALLLFGVVNPKLFFRTMGKSLFVIIAINLVFGFSVNGIDNSAHIGGLIGGFLGAGIVYLPKKKNWRLQGLFLLFSIVLVAGALTYGFSASAKRIDEKSNIAIAAACMNEKNFDEAYKILKVSEKYLPHPSARMYLILGYVELNKKDKLSNAKADLTKAIKLDPKMSEAYYYLAAWNLKKNDVREAKKYADQALKLKPSDKDYLQMTADINRYLEQTGK